VAGMDDANEDANEYKTNVGQRADDLMNKHMGSGFNSSPKAVAPGASPTGFSSGDTSFNNPPRANASPSGSAGPSASNNPPRGAEVAGNVAGEIAGAFSGALSYGKVRGQF
jgi:hypothetical protein